MKRHYVLFIIALFLSLTASDFCYAEKIYCKDGKVVYGNIIYRTKSSIWVRHASGAVGVSLDNIDRIENDDGSISRYDYKFFYNATQDYVSQKNYSEAINMCSLLLKSFPDNAQIHYLRAIISHKLGYAEQAIQDYNFLIENGLADADVFNNLGAIYADNKEYKKAAELFSMALKSDLKMTEAYNNLAEVLMQIKDYNGAIKEYNKVLKLEADNTRALYNSGIAYMKKGMYGKAREMWEKILSIKPDDADAKRALERLIARTHIQ